MVLALKALLASLSSRTEKPQGEVTVGINGKTAATVKIAPQDFDVMRLVDLGEYVREGANEVTLRFAGEGSARYQVSALCYVPCRLVPRQKEALSISISYDRTELTTRDIITETITIKNNLPGRAHGCCRSRHSPGV